METVLEKDTYLMRGVALTQDGRELIIDLCDPMKIRIVGHDGTTGKQKEYFLKVTERKGLVLV